MIKLDKNGRPNAGFAHINSNPRFNKKHYEKRLMVSISQEDYDFCKNWANERNVTLSEQIRTYIAWGIEEDKK